MKLLLTGFEPFGGEAINPSLEAVRRVPDVLDGVEIFKLAVPCVFERCGPVAEAAVRAHRPDAVLCVGQAGGRAGVTVERVAINLADARIPDNAGAQPVDEPLRAGGPAAYFASIPVKAVVRAVEGQGIPCALSYTAGTYVCNCLLYRVLDLAAREFPGMRAGFVHLPYAEQQLPGKPDGTPALPLETMVRALETAARTIAAQQTDLAVGMGALC